MNRWKVFSSPLKGVVSLFFFSLRLRLLLLPKVASGKIVGSYQSIPFQLSFFEGGYENNHWACFLFDGMSYSDFWCGLNKRCVLWFSKHQISNAWILPCSSIVNVQNSQSCRKMHSTTRSLISDRCSRYSR